VVNFEQASGDFIVRASQGRSLYRDGDDLFEQLSASPATVLQFVLKRRPDWQARLASRSKLHALVVAEAAHEKRIIITLVSVPLVSPGE